MMILCSKDIDNKRKKKEPPDIKKKKVLEYTNKECYIRDEDSR